MRLPILLFVLLLSVKGFSTNYYVSLQGNTTNSGKSIDSTWSLAKVNSYIGSFNSGDSILFKRGQTFVGKIVVSKSGLKFGAYGTGRKPVLTTLTQISQWTLLSTGIYESPVQTLTSELNLCLINDSAMEKGRFPDAGYLTIDSYASGSVTSSGITGSWTGGDVVIRVSRFETDRYPIASQSGTTLKYTGKSPTRSGMGLFINNHPGTLNRFGEWYYDNTAKKLRVFFGSAGPTGYKVEIPTGGNVFTINPGISNVTITGLDLKGGNNDGVIVSTSTGSAGSGNSVINSTIRMMGENGIYAQKQTNFTATGDSIMYTGDNGVGVNIYNIDTSYQTTLYWGTNVSNNYINKTFYYPGMTDGGLIDGWSIRVDANHSTISGNRIFNSGYQGIGGLADYVVISNNYINGFCSVKDDGAAIYTWGPKSSQNWNINAPHAPVQAVGRFIQNNIVENGVGATAGSADQAAAHSGIYTDDQSNHVWITGNTVAHLKGSGIYFHNSQYISAHDNIVYDCAEAGLLTRHDNLGWNIQHLDVSRNVFFAIDQTAYSIKSFTRDITPDIGQMGKIDSNYYCRPLNELSTSNMFYWRVGGSTNSDGSQNPGTKLSLSGWKAAFIYDDSSKLTYRTGTTVTNSSNFRLETNPSGQNRTVALGNNVYKDHAGVTYNTGSLVLAPWQSKVLILTGTGSVVNTKPVVTLTTPANGTSYPNNSPITLNASATDADGANTITKVVFYRGNIAIDSAITGIDNSGSTYLGSWTPSTTGSYAITARVYDVAGGIDTSNTAVITVTTPTLQDPAVYISSPVDASTYLTTDSIPFTAVPSDADGTVDKVEFLVNGTVFKTITSAPYSFKWKFPAEGVYTITARATDNDLRTKTSDPITVNVHAAATNISVIITSPSNNAPFQAPATITINVTATIQ